MPHSFLVTAKTAAPAPFLPMSRSQMAALGWERCDIILVTGDAYVDHPSFGMAIVGRLLESQGFRVGILAQPDWRSVDDFSALGRPRLFFGVTAGNMDSMINRYTADRKIRSDDAYTPGGAGGARPDRSVLVYAQRCRERYPDSTIVLGGIEASLRRIAHYDYWQDKVRRSILIDAKADLLVYGNAERAIVEVAQRLAKGEAIADIRDVRGTAFVCSATPPGYRVIDARSVIPGSAMDDAWGKVPLPPAKPNPYQEAGTPPAQAEADAEPEPAAANSSVIRFYRAGTAPQNASAAAVPATTGGEATAGTEEVLEKAAIRLPDYEAVVADSLLYAHASRILHLETNPGNARALMQQHGERLLWLNPPPIPLTTEEMDFVYDLPYARAPHPSYGEAKIPAWDMIRHSINIMRGCFGGCTFCSITEHEGRIIQSRSEASILREMEAIRDKVPSFTGIISDLGGPTANMFHMRCKDPAIEASCRRPSCVYPKICKNLDTDHSRLIDLYRQARAVPGVKKVLIGSGVRYDLAITSPEYVKELVTHHVGGYLKIAPEHSEEAPLAKMMKPGMGSYQRFKELFERYSREAGKEQYLIPYFIAAHPGTRDEDMLELALWLKRNGFRPDQVQAFYPSPMATATAMYHSGKNPLHKIHAGSEAVTVVKSSRQRALHKAFLRYHDPANWPVLRQALVRMGRRDLIGNSRHHLVPWSQTVPGRSLPRAKVGHRALTQHTGLPPRQQGRSAKAAPRLSRSG